MSTIPADREWPRPRARIGLIIPSVNTLTEPQFSRFAPRGVEIHVSRTRIDLAKSLLDQTPDILTAAALLADCGCDLIVYHCTGMSMGSGRDAERRLVETIAQTTGRPAGSTATAIVTAFRALGTAKVVLASPYEQWVNDREMAFLADADIKVLRDRALDLPVPDGMCGATPDFWVQAAMEAAHPDADTYFLSCTNIQSIDAISELEARLDKPVVTSNQASLWYCLRSCGLADDVPALGRLFGLGLPRSQDAQRRMN